ncbi:hypothetical protein Abr02nite_22620 [Paractinoplanes brasiliensis]|nr:hypothetical protein Abr02nite_22620 [Actinoplanes brasiliensis]
MTGTGVVEGTLRTGAVTSISSLGQHDQQRTRHAEDQQLTAPFRTYILIDGYDIPKRAWQRSESRLAIL